MTLSPLHRYQQDLKKPGFVHDLAQQQAIEKLQDLYQRLCQSQKKTGLRSWLTTLGLVLGGDSGLEKGLYFWGGVGRGKTYLMDIFYESLPFEQKMRVHFHRFMRRVHGELKTLKQQKNPLDIVAKRLAQDARVICFDEFFVTDITDAMILAQLLKGLFDSGVTLVATSNIVPDGLYQDGLQRARFLPAIALLNEHTEVVNVDGGTDYRLRTLEQAELYHWPLDRQADVSLTASFESLVPDINEVVADFSLEIEGRYIATRFHAEDVVWCDFKALCDGPRSQNDYIEIAMEYHAVLVSDIPELTEKREDQARRFINLVDEFYDRSVKLIISADKPIDQLYSGQRLVFEFERTQSRLLEMQSHEYLARPHKP
ncbi:MAG: cell division protein ZapE [Pseudomonadota bacterium]